MKSTTVGQADNHICAVLGQLGRTEDYHAILI
jgi:hypothetical protein